MRLRRVLVAISRDDWKAGRWTLGRGSPHIDEVAVRTTPMPMSALREGPPLPDPPPASSSLLFDVLLPSSRREETAHSPGLRKEPVEQEAADRG